jgi:WD40 repeat protein
MSTSLQSGNWRRRSSRIPDRRPRQRPAFEVLEARFAPAFLLTGALDLNNHSTDNVSRYNLPVPAPGMGWFHAASTPLTNPLGMALAADHLHAYVATATGSTDGAIRVVAFPNASTISLSSTPFNTKTISPLGEIFAMAVSPRDGELYVADRDNNKIIRFDSNGVGTDVITNATNPGLVKPIGLAFSADGGTLYVGNDSNNFDPGNA